VVEERDRTTLFEAHRDHLRAVAYRMLGSAHEADDAVQQAWLRASTADLDAVGNLGGWFTTVTSRVCLDALRSRGRRAEQPLAVGADAVAHAGVAAEPGGAVAVRAADPADAAEHAEAVAEAMLVVLDRLSPAERVAFVLYDLFAVPFDEIATVVGRSAVATKKLASRARARVRAVRPTRASSPTCRHTVPSSRRFAGRQRAATSALCSASSPPTSCAEPSPGHRPGRARSGGRTPSPRTRGASAPAPATARSLWSTGARAS
jgi:RNA polymerase sigma-70 factor, ECF subfamily